MVRLYGPEGTGPVGETIWILCSGLHASLAVPKVTMVVALGSSDVSLGELARQERTFVLVHQVRSFCPY